MADHHDHGCCGHNHGDSPEDKGAEFSLYLKINKDLVQCLNETVEGSGKVVFRPWDERLDRTMFVESDADEELLFNIPFTGNVKLKSIIVIGGGDDSHPDQMKLYKNRPNMSFDDTRTEPEQSFQLSQDPDGQIEYNTKVARFSQVEHLSIFFPSNFGNEKTRVHYIGLKGDFTQARRHEVTITTYEARANPADHKTNLLDNVNFEIQ